MTEKHTWNQVKTVSLPSHRPSSRWGHSCCVIQNDIVFFGGYADSTYMNDLWAFDSISMKWREVETKGDIPIQRSNCSMNYDIENNRIIIFGGGGANKQRFNSISILCWETKTWTEITPRENENAPWERTYHSAEYISPYLIVFGGEGVTDLDDLWIFDFKTLTWREVNMPAGKVKPCARRFHSSVSIGNEFFVLAGCHGKYRCLSDVYSIDLTSLLNTGSIESLEWEEKKLKNSSFLTRWGHSSAVYNKKIYVFGGRFSNDLNDTLVADLEEGTIRQIKISVQAPAARRRHCAGFIGSNMLVFGGFNGQYFQDLNYINLNESKQKFDLSVSSESQESNFLQIHLNNSQFADRYIETCKGQKFYIHRGLTSYLFSNLEKLQKFFDSIDGIYTVEQLETIIKNMYDGFGPMSNLDKEFRNQIEIASVKSDRLIKLKSSIEGEVDEKNYFRKHIINSNFIIKLGVEKFEEFIRESCEKQFADQTIKIADNCFWVNRIKLMSKSEYFEKLFSMESDEETISIPEILPESVQNRLIYHIFFNFLYNDWLVLHDNYSEKTLIKLAVLSDYFCVPKLAQICSNQLTTRIGMENVESLLTFSSKFKQLSDLTMNCCNFWITQRSLLTSVSDIEQSISRQFQNRKYIQNCLLTVINRIRFDLSQSNNEIFSPQKSIISSKADTNSEMQKENFQSNVYGQ